MQQYLRFGEFKIFNAPVYVHWSVLAVSVFILVVYFQNLVTVAIAVASFFCITFVHEIGHAAVANKMGYRVFSLKLCLFHGLCEYESPYYEWDDVKISWGGVLAQVLIAILVFTLSSLGARNIDFFAPILLFLGYYSLFIIPFNLLPVRGLDGYKAWRIIPLALKQIRNR